MSTNRRLELGAQKTAAWMDYQRARNNTMEVAIRLRAEIVFDLPSYQAELALARADAEVIKCSSYIAAVEAELAALERYELLNVEYVNTSIFEVRDG